MEKKSVLITGAAGFVGSHLCEKFLNSGYAVLGVDNLLTGREQNLKDCFSNPHFRFEQFDITNVRTFLPPTGKRFSKILHFACPASPIDFDKLSMEILRVDSIGTLNMLEACKENNASFMIASTSEVYGDPMVHPQKEDYFGNVNPIGPRACYDEAKRFSESAVMSYHRKYHLDTKIVRIFNTYGPRMRLNDGRLVPQLCNQAMNREKLTVHGDGSQTRSLCFVSDLVEGIFLLSESRENFPVNIGNPVEFSILRFIEMLEKIFQRKLEATFLPAREDDPRRRCPDIAKAKALLHWSPKISLEDGLKKTIEHFEKELQK